METLIYDYIVVGSGIAGLTAARVLSDYGRTCVLTKSILKEGATHYAQGGIAVAMQPDDSPQFHLNDTLLAGDGLCNEYAVRILVEEGPKWVRELIELGAQFDKVGDHFHFTQEAAHHKRRILHAGDATGREIEKTLGNTILREDKVQFFPQTSLTQLLINEGHCVGCIAQHKGKPVRFIGKAVVLSTGGCGQIFSHNTNPPVATGDGIALAYQAGCAVQDMEFTQFHPTTLYLGDPHPASLFLISEAVRGEGAILRNCHGDRFMTDYHAEAELAPRDVVARAIFDQMNKTQTPHVYLDLEKVKQNPTERFPTIYKRCKEANIDITRDFIPVAPAAHYFMGGIQTDTWGLTTIPALYAIGEVACLGLHGANRLASNSLLDGLVFGHRAARHASEHQTHLAVPPRPLLASFEQGLADSERARVLASKQSIRELMWAHVGILRHQEGLLCAQKGLKELEWLTHSHSENETLLEVKNMWQVATLMTEFALTRTESRGSHLRSDFPIRDDLYWKRHLSKTKESTDGL